MQRQSVYQADGQDIVAVCVRFPRTLYERIKTDAAQDNRSLGRQTVHLCMLAMQETRKRERETAATQ